MQNPFTKCIRYETVFILTKISWFNLKFILHIFLSLHLNIIKKKQLIYTILNKDILIFQMPTSY